MSEEGISCDGCDGGEHLQEERSRKGRVQGGGQEEDESRRRMRARGEEEGRKTTGRGGTRDVKEDRGRR
eukprot:552431-Hanusia_phi.AAC.1